MDWEGFRTATFVIAVAGWVMYLWARPKPKEWRPPLIFRSPLFEVTRDYFLALTRALAVAGTIGFVASFVLPL